MAYYITVGHGHNSRPWASNISSVLILTFLVKRADYSKNEILWSNVEFRFTDFGKNI